MVFFFLHRLQGFSPSQRRLLVLQWLQRSLLAKRRSGFFSYEQTHFRRTHVLHGVLPSQVSPFDAHRLHFSSLGCGLPFPPFVIVSCG